jgi:hypothetical protein
VYRRPGLRQAQQHRLPVQQAAASSPVREQVQVRVQRAFGRKQ